MITKRLKDPFSHDPGYGLPVVVYERVALIGFRADCANGELYLQMQYGNTDAEGNWVASPLKPITIPLVNRQEDLLGVDVEGRMRARPADLKFDDLAAGWLQTFIDAAMLWVGTDNKALEQL
jgi:hypothetical protein